jgi:hypothetical protein
VADLDRGFWARVPHFCILGAIVLPCLAYLCRAAGFDTPFFFAILGDSFVIALSLFGPWLWHLFSPPMGLVWGMLWILGKPGYWRTFVGCILLLVATIHLGGSGIPIKVGFRLNQERLTRFIDQQGGEPSAVSASVGFYRVLSYERYSNGADVLAIDMWAGSAVGSISETGELEAGFVRLSSSEELSVGAQLGPARYVIGRLGSGWYEWRAK